MTEPLRVLDLFSGIGGFSLGLERTGGFETVAFCENDKKAQLVLRKHWPSVPIFDDVKELNHEQLRAESIVPDVVCGGFPCQDISNAGRGVGIVGERSGLWAHMARIIGEVSPRWVIAENVSALRSKGLALVLQDICSIGYRVEWHCIPACAIGAKHRRDRVWIVAYANEPRLERRDSSVVPQCSIQLPTWEGGSRQGGLQDHWLTESEVGRVADGIPRRVDRLRQLGNAVVPQIVTAIGTAILDCECRIVGEPL